MWLNVEWFRVNQIRKARQRFVDRGGENVGISGLEALLELRRKDVWQERQWEGQNNEEFLNTCEPQVERTESYEIKIR